MGSSPSALLPSCTAAAGDMDDDVQDFRSCVSDDDDNEEEEDQEFVDDSFFDEFCGEEETDQNEEEALVAALGAVEFPMTAAGAPLDTGMYATPPRGHLQNKLVSSWSHLAVGGYVVEHCVSGTAAADALVKLLKNPLLKPGDLVSGRACLAAVKRQMKKTHAPLQVIQTPVSFGHPSADGTPAAPPIAAWKGQHVTHRPLVSVLGEAMCVSCTPFTEGWLADPGHDVETNSCAGSFCDTLVENVRLRLQCSSCYYC